MDSAQTQVDKSEHGSSRAQMPTARLGKNGPQVSRIGYGAMGLSAAYGPALPDEDRYKVLDSLYAAGELFWDTADIYKDSEILLARWFERNPGKREDIFLATKFAFKTNEDGEQSLDTSPEYCRQAIETSLKRLGLPYVDLYYAHRLGDTPVEITVGAMKELQEQGKIKYIGLSECSAETLRRASKVVHIDAVEVEYSPFTLDIEKAGLVDACRELGTAIVCYSPLSRGMLGGQIRSYDDLSDDDWRKKVPRFSPENFDKNLELVDQIRSMAEKKNITAGQLTLAWILAQGEDFFPIPGTTNIKRVKENTDAAYVQLSKEEVDEVRKFVDAADVQGGRLGEEGSSLLLADTPAMK